MRKKLIFAVVSAVFFTFKAYAGKSKTILQIPSEKVVIADQSNVPLLFENSKKEKIWLFADRFALKYFTGSNGQWSDPVTLKYNDKFIEDLYKNLNTNIAFISYRLSQDKVLLVIKSGIVYGEQYSLVFNLNSLSVESFEKFVPVDPLINEPFPGGAGIVVREGAKYFSTCSKPKKVMHTYSRIKRDSETGQLQDRRFFKIFQNGAWSTSRELPFGDKLSKHYQNYVSLFQTVIPGNCLKEGKEFYVYSHLVRKDSASDYLPDSGIVISKMNFKSGVEELITHNFNYFDLFPTEDEKSRFTYAFGGITKNNLLRLKIFSDKRGKSRNLADISIDLSEDMPPIKSNVTEYGPYVLFKSLKLDSGNDAGFVAVDLKNKFDTEFWASGFSDKSTKVDSSDAVGLGRYLVSDVRGFQFEDDLYLPVYEVYSEESDKIFGMLSLDTRLAKLSFTEIELLDSNTYPIERSKTFRSDNKISLYYALWDEDPSRTNAVHLREWTEE